MMESWTQNQTQANSGSSSVALLQLERRLSLKMMLYQRLALQNYLGISSVVPYSYNGNLWASFNLLRWDGV